MLLLFGCGYLWAYVEPEEAYLNKEYSLCVELSQKKFKKTRHDKYLWLEGLSQMNLGFYDKARDCFKRLLKNFPHSSFKEEALLGVGDTYLYEQNFSQAYNIYKGYLDRSAPKDILGPLYWRLGKVCLKLGKWDEARKYFETLSSGEGYFAQEGRRLLNPDNFYFTVKVGSFIERSNALKLKDKLGKMNIPVEIRKKSSGGEVFYMVCAGHFSRRTQALKMKKRLEELGYPGIILP